MLKTKKILIKKMLNNLKMLNINKQKLQKFIQKMSKTKKILIKKMLNNFRIMKMLKINR